MDEEFSFLLWAGIVLLICAGMWFWLEFLAPPLPPKTYPYSCYDPSTDTHQWCRIQDTTLIDVSLPMR